MQIKELKYVIFDTHKWLSVSSMYIESESQERGLCEIER
jgi:hypothetical protein